MPASHPTSKIRAREPGLYNAAIDEFLTWIAEDHDEWHRGMAELREDPERRVGARRTRGPRRNIARAWLTSSTIVDPHRATLGAT